LNKQDTDWNFKAVPIYKGIAKQSKPYVKFVWENPLTCKQVLIL
jgi:hypothetical protein